MDPGADGGGWSTNVPYCGGMEEEENYKARKKTEQPK